MPTSLRKRFSLALPKPYWTLMQPKQRVRCHTLLVWDFGYITEDQTDLRQDRTKGSHRTDTNRMMYFEERKKLSKKKILIGKELMNETVYWRCRSTRGWRCIFIYSAGVADIRILSTVLNCFSHPSLVKFSVLRLGAFHSCLAGCPGLCSLPAKVRGGSTFLSPTLQTFEIPCHFKNIWFCSTFKQLSDRKGFYTQFLINYVK